MSNDKKVFIKDLISMALPVGLQNMVNSAVTLADNIMIGSLGDDCITAVNICWTYSWMYSTITTAFANGALIMIARLWSSGNKKDIKKLMSFTLIVNIALAIILSIVTSVYPDKILRIYSDMNSMIPVGVKYLKIMNYSYLLNTIGFSIMILLRSIRKVKISMYTSFASCIINVVLNYILIFGKFGFAPMQIEGAAIASLVARSFEVLVVFFYLFFYEKELHLRLNEFNPFVQQTTIMDLLKLTIPLLIVDFLASRVSTVQTIITGHVSKYYISANSIVHTSWEFPNIFCWGIMQAANVMIGNLIGEKQYETAFLYSRYFAYSGVIIGALTSIVLHLVLAGILPLYNVDPETIKLVSQLSYSASFILLFSSFYTITGDGVIKAGGNTQNLLKLDLICSWFIVLPLGALCAFVFHLPASILYIVLRSNNIIKSIWTIWKLKKKDWIVQLNS